MFMNLWKCVCVFVCVCVGGGWCKALDVHGGGVTKIEPIRTRGRGPNFGPFKNSTFGVKFRRSMKCGKDISLRQVEINRYRIGVSGDLFFQVSLPDSVNGERSSVSSISNDEGWEQVQYDDVQPTLWLPDHVSPCCSSCGCYFSILIRRHHCR